MPNRECFGMAGWGHPAVCNCHGFPSDDIAIERKTRLSGQMGKLFSCFIMRWGPIDNMSKRDISDRYLPADGTYDLLPLFILI
jgi:hypothetical protein